MAISALVGSMPSADELGALLSQVEEELALRLRRPELHEAPVVQDEPQDVRADPPGGVRRELHAAVRVVALHGLHQADVPLLDEVHDVLVGAPVLVGDLHHEAQVRRHQPRGGRRVLRLDELLGQRLRLLGREQRVPLHLAQVRRERIEALDRGGFARLARLRVAEAGSPRRRPPRGRPRRRRARRPRLSLVARPSSSASPGSPSSPSSAPPPPPARARADLAVALGAFRRGASSSVDRGGLVVRGKALLRVLSVPMPSTCDAG